MVAVFEVMADVALVASQSVSTEPDDDITPVVHVSKSFTFGEEVKWFATREPTENRFSRDVCGRSEGCELLPK